MSIKAITIPEAFMQSALKNSENTCLLYKKGHLFEEVSYKRLLNLVQNLTLSLRKLGIKEGDRVAILSENRPEWVVSDLAIISLRAIVVPIHAYLSPKQIENAILEVEPKIIIVSDKRLLYKLIKIKKEIERKITLVYYNISLEEDLREFDADKRYFIDALKLIPHEDYDSNVTYLDIVRNVKASDTASIIFAIRENGKYNGVELTHSNIVSNVLSCKEAVKFKKNDRFMSILPLTHAFERTAGCLIPLFTGSSIVYYSDFTKVDREISEYKPTVIIGVPRFFEKVKEHVKPKTNTALEKDYQKLKIALGNKARILISGGAPLDYEVGKFFSEAGVPILEGYGLTEASPVVSVNRVDSNKLGTVGKPLPNIRVKIADDGEVLIKSPGVMRGYYGNGLGPKLELNNGWLKTGDLGEIDIDGYLKIKGRKRDLIVLSTGNKVCPSLIEMQLLKSKYIKKVTIKGDSKKHISAVIVPNLTALQAKVNLKDNSSIIKIPEVRELLKTEIAKLLINFASHEQVKDIFVA